MAPIERLLLLALLSTALTISSGSGDGYTINGRVKIPQGLGTKGFVLPGKMSNVKVILNGGQIVTYLRPDGYFSLYANVYQFLFNFRVGLLGFEPKFSFLTSLLPRRPRSW